MRPVPIIALFCSFLVSCLSGMLLRHFLIDFDVVPVAPVVTGVTFVFYILHALYFFCMVFMS